MMKKIIILLALVTMVLVGCTSSPPATSDSNEPANSSAPTYDVSIQNFSFSPATLTIKRGDTVRWTNQDSVQHTATADNGFFDTGLLSQGQSDTVTFTTTGTFSYYCTPHPNMRATIIVEE